MEDPFEDYIKMVRNTKTDRPKNEKENTEVSSQSVLLTLQRRQECEAKAVKIVEFLIEGKLRPEVFLRCLKHINKSYYQEVVEERAISNLCGYSLCDNQIPEMPKKQFYISTKSNKVYDVTDRKNYCSNFCYKASVHIKQQVDDSPLWMRKLENCSKLNLLSQSERGSPGEEINQGLVTASLEPVFTSVSSFTEISLNEMCETEDKVKTNHIIKKPTVMQTLNESDEVEEVQTTKHVHFADKYVKQSNPKIVKKHKKPAKPPIDVFENIKRYLQEWVTLNTYIFVYGEAKIKEFVSEEQLNEYLQASKQAESKVAMQKKYVDICRKLELTQLAENKFDRAVIGSEMKPVPDYKKLKEDSKEMDLKIRCFYGGVSYESNRNSSKKENTEQIVEKDEAIAVLPLVDMHSQMAIRRKIYLTSIRRTMTNLAQNLGIASHYIMDDVQSLVKTFKLEAHNIVFKPVIWNLIALTLIKLLSLRDHNLKIQLETKRSETFANIMLNQFPNGQTSFNELLERFEDIDLFLKRYFSESDS